MNPTSFSQRITHRLNLGLKLLAWALAVQLAPPALSAADEKPDATGDWKLSITTQNGETINPVLKLKQDGDRLTGTIAGRDGNEITIENGTINGDEISFEITRERDGRKFTAKSTGKISGDSIKGKTQWERDGETRSHDWEGKRERASSTADAGGVWKWAFTTQGGQTFEPSVKLKQEGEHLTGAVKWGENEMKISDGKISDGEVSFNVIRDRDGRKVTSKYRARLDHDSLKGKIETDWSGENQSFDWEAVRVKE